MRAFVLGVCLLLLSGCGDDYERQFWRLEKLMAWNRIGSSSDYWLVKRSVLLPELDRVALIFGFGSDLDFCLEVAELYMRKYPASVYSCNPAN